MNGVQGVQDTEATRDAIVQALLAQQAAAGGGIGGGIGGIGGGAFAQPGLEIGDVRPQPGTGLTGNVMPPIVRPGFEIPGAQAPTPGGGSPYGMGNDAAISSQIGAENAAMNAASKGNVSPGFADAVFGLGTPEALGPSTPQGVIDSAFDALGPSTPQGVIDSGFNAITADNPNLGGLTAAGLLGGYADPGMNPGTQGAIGTRGGGQVAVNPGINTGFNVGFDTGFNTGFDAGAAAAAGGGEGAGMGDGPAGAATAGGPGGPDAGTGTEGGHGGEGS